MHTEFVLALFVVLGLLSGLLGGLLGIGGGVVTVPFLYYIFLYTESYSDKPMHVAICTSLAAAFITSALSSYFQIRKKAIQFLIVKWMLPSLIIGCAVGAFAAYEMGTRILSLSFATIAGLMGIYFFFPQLPHLHIASKPNPSIALFALIIGALSTLLGIGGGSVALPILLGYQIPMKNASATSSITTFFTTGAGTLSYLIIAWNFPGYIDLQSWALISIGSVVTSGLGVKLAHDLKVPLIKRIFGCCLILIALSMFFL